MLGELFTKHKTKIMIAGGLIAAYLIYRKFAGHHEIAQADAAPESHAALPQPVGKSLPEAPVGASEPVTAKTFQFISARRPGYVYVPAKLVSGQIAFTNVSRPGTFTRNVLRVKNNLYAEVRV